MNAATVKKTITNEDLWSVLQKLVGEVQNLVGEVQDNSQNLSDFITMTGKKFDAVDRQFDVVNRRFDTVDARFNQSDNRLASFEVQLLLIKTKLQSNDLRLAELKESVDTLLGEHKAYINDISDALDRITVLEERMPNITEQEMRELQTLLQSVVHWAIKAASAVDVPIKLPV